MVALTMGGWALTAGVFLVGSTALLRRSSGSDPGEEVLPLDPGLLLLRLTLKDPHNQMDLFGV